MGWELAKQSRTEGRRIDPHVQQWRRSLYFWFAVDGVFYRERVQYVSAHCDCLSAGLPREHTLLSAPRAPSRAG
jgi:hypothetical protein